LHGGVGKELRPTFNLKDPVVSVVLKVISCHEATLFWLEK